MLVVLVSRMNWLLVRPLLSRIWVTSQGDLDLVSLTLPSYLTGDLDPIRFPNMWPWPCDLDPTRFPFTWPWPRELGLVTLTLSGNLGSDLDLSYPDLGSSTLLDSLVGDLNIHHLTIHLWCLFLIRELACTWFYLIMLWHWKSLVAYDTLPFLLVWMHTSA